MEPAGAGFDGHRSLSGAMSLGGCGNKSLDRMLILSCGLPCSSSSDQQDLSTFSDPKLRSAKGSSAMAVMGIDKRSTHNAIKETA
jgi:hypothetical protein